MGTGLYQRTETMSIGFTRTPFCITSKCRWKPVLSPVLPTYPITCPAVTASPAVTAVCVMWAYRVDKPAPFRV